MKSSGMNNEQTVIWKLGKLSSTRNNDQELTESLSEAANLLAQGELVAFPTETVYGLGADARNTEAVAGIFSAKGRPSDNPLIVHIADRAVLSEFVAEVLEADEKLMDAFWPGPLTLVLPVKPGVLSPKVTAGLDTVAVRMPDHPIALALIAESACPLAAPSANRSGRPSPTTAEHVYADLNGRIHGIVDGGAAGVGVESTVVRTNASGEATVLRPGGISIGELSQVLGASVREVSADHGKDINPAQAVNVEDTVETLSATDEQQFLKSTAEDTLQKAVNFAEEAPRSPGMKYTHYAPSGMLEVCVGDEQEVKPEIQKRLSAARVRGEKTGLLVFDEHLKSYATSADVILSLGSKHDLREAASRLYAALRRFDDEQTTYMLAEGCSEDGIGAAIMNRMSKAAGGKVYHV